MKISSFQAQNMVGIKQALGMNMLQKTMNQDAQSVEAVVKMMEASVNPSLGQNIDLKV